MPTAKKITATPMKPLGERTNNSSCHDSIIQIFNNAQHVTSTDVSLAELKKLYRNTDYHEFIAPFKHCLRNLLQSSQANKLFFNTACDFVCNFLQYVSDIRTANQSGGEAPENQEQQHKEQQQSHNRSTKGGRSKKNPNKRKQVPLDELADVGSFLSQESVAPPMETYVVTNHDRLMSVVVLDVVNQYMQSIDDDCRCNAVIFTCKLLSVVQSLDLEICEVLKNTLPKRMRDKKALIRAHAVLASRTFQDCKLIREAFIHHYERDPELIVRKALIQVMDTKVFKYGFLVDSTRDPQEPLRKIAYQRLGTVDPMDLALEERHRVLHNGLNERCRQLAYMFRCRTLEPWFKKMYDRCDLLKLLKSFDIVNYTDDMQRLVDIIYTEDLENIQPGGNTKLHMNVEWLRQNLLDPQTRLPILGRLDEGSVFLWLSMINFCKNNSSQISTVKLTAQVDANASIEKLIDTNENQIVEEVDLYERLAPDLVTLCEYIKKLVDHFFGIISKDSKVSTTGFEFIYQRIMKFVESYAIGDDLEHKSVQEVFRILLKENLLTGSFQNFVTPIMRCLAKMIYKTSPNLMVSLVSDMINDVRSNLEDLNVGSQRSSTQQNAIAKSSTPFKPRESFARPSYCPEDIEGQIAQYRVDLAEAQDDYDKFLGEKNFAETEKVWQKMSDLKTKMKLLKDRRDSIAFSDIGFAGTSYSNATANLQDIDLDNEDRQLFKHHRADLLKCLQMFAGCFEFCDLREVPPTMTSHLTLLSLEGMEFSSDPIIKSLVIRCTGLASLVSEEFATELGTLAMLFGGCKDPMIEVKTQSYRCLVDILIQHRDIKFPDNELDLIFRGPMKNYGKFDPKDEKKSNLHYLLTIIEGITKLFYFEKIFSPDLLADLILWWYHPRTHSRVKQYIGVFLPIFVEDVSKRSKESELKLRKLLEDTFLVSIESLHAYILGPGFNIMSASDMFCMIRFMCSLMPVASHTSIAIKVARRIRELSRYQEDSYNDLCGYLIGSFSSFDIRRASTDDLNDLENALSELECVVENLSVKNKQLKAQYNKFRHQVEIAERLPDSPRKRSFDEFQSTMIEMDGPDNNKDPDNDESNDIKDKTVLEVAFGQKDAEPEFDNLSDGDPSEEEDIMLEE